MLSGKTRAGKLIVDRRLCERCGDGECVMKEEILAR